MIYTRQMREAVHKIKVPHYLTTDIVEYPFHPPFLALRFYYTQWASLTEPERMNAIKYLKTVKRTLETMGARVTLEPIDDRFGPVVE